MSDNHSHIELLFAMEVRDRANKLRYQGVPEYLKNSDDEISRAELKEWMAKHPLESYYPTILDAVVESANAIRGILAAN